MAVVRNITPDRLHLFSTDAPPCDPGDVVTIRDEVFVDRAWPSSTWDVVEPPVMDGYVDCSTDDAHLWTIPVIGEVEGVLVTDEPLAGTGEAVNADTGEVTQPGDPLPPIADPDPEAAPATKRGKQS